MKLLGLMVGVMLTSSMVIAGVHERVDYYCFLKLENGQDWFSEYSFDGLNRPGFRGGSNF